MKYFKLLVGSLNIPYVADIVFTVLRVFVAVIMIGAALSKFPINSHFIHQVRQMGFPAPEFFAYVAAISEFLGGLFLLLGVFTRIGGLLLFSVMFVAGFIHHAKDPIMVKLAALLIMFIALQFVVIGGGRYSIDRFLRNI